MARAIRSIFAGCIAAGAFALMGCASGPPKAHPLLLEGVEPTWRHNAGHERYDVYVMKREGGGYATKVCVRYRETGSHVWRNSCRRNVTRSMSFRSPLVTTSYNLSHVGQIPPVHSSAVPEEIAARLEAAFNVVLNGDVSIVDLDETGETAPPP